MVDKESVYTAEGGLAEITGFPEYGRQDIGFSPGGAMDLFSLVTGNILLNNDPSAPGLEIILPPKITFTAKCCFVLTGAGREECTLISHDGKSKPIKHAAVYSAEPGARLTLGKLSYGFRTYLCTSPVSSKSIVKKIEGRERGRFKDMFTWQEKSSRIRVIEGPEYSNISDPETFLNTAWKTTTDMNRMGIRLASHSAYAEPEMGQMVSGPVNDGTVQLTPQSPIILLRARQTVGGYPRIFNVISADIDLLAQFGPHQVIRFMKVTLDEALSTARQKAKEIEGFRNCFSI
jgi:allophanate hydrolase subunit 2